MQVRSTTWDNLPDLVRQQVEECCGPVHDSDPAGEGLNTDLRLILRTASGDVFAKGVQAEDERRAWMLDAGAELTPYVEAIAPKLLWHVQAAGWDIAGYACIPGRPWADMSPGSPDIPRITATLTVLAGIPAPSVLTVTAADCWGRYADDPAILAGDRLAHRDPNPANFVIDGDRAWLVDWGWAVRGPAWLTPAQFVLALLEAGWDAGDAEDAVAAVPGWADAPPGDVAGFAAANSRMWDEALEGVPGWPIDFRAGIARAWAGHRAAMAA